MCFKVWVYPKIPKPIIIHIENEDFILFKNIGAKSLVKANSTYLGGVYSKSAKKFYY